MTYTTAATWLWIPIVVWAALAQTARNAAQRSLTAQAGTLGATLVRFLYGLPFAAAWVAVLHTAGGASLHVPSFDAAYFAWVLFGGLSQIAATAFLLAAMKERHFVIAVAFSKTEVLQVAVFSTLFLGELPGWLSMLAVGVATVGVLLLSLPQKTSEDAAAKRGGESNGKSSGRWNGKIVAFGLASGAGFALSAVGYRGAALQLPPGTSAWLAGAWGVLWAQAMQSLVLVSWIAWRQRETLTAVAKAWRISLVAGAAGAFASIGWFTAFAMRPAADVRTLGLVEVFFSYLVSRRLMREDLSVPEKAGLALVMAGVLLVCLQL